MFCRPFSRQVLSTIGRPSGKAPYYLINGIIKQMPISTNRFVLCVFASLRFKKNRLKVHLWRLAFPRSALNRPRTGSPSHPTHRVAPPFGVGGNKRDPDKASGPHGFYLRKQRLAGNVAAGATTVFHDTQGQQRQNDAITKNAGHLHGITHGSGQDRQGDQHGCHESGEERAVVFHVIYFLFYVNPPQNGAGRPILYHHSNQ